MANEKKILAIKNGVTKQFAVTAWNNMPKDKYGWQAIDKMPEKPKPPEEIISHMGGGNVAPPPPPTPEIIDEFDPSGNMESPISGADEALESAATAPMTETNNAPPADPAPVAATPQPAAPQPAPIVAKKKGADVKTANTAKRGRPAKRR